jgi:hypothetical protein
MPRTETSARGGWTVTEPRSSNPAQSMTAPGRVIDRCRDGRGLRDVVDALPVDQPDVGV